MPTREDIRKVLIIGSGPTIIGQACEFDYSGTQACKALRKLGFEIVLVNSNPATIMTDPGMADVTYIEPLNLESLKDIIEKERPDALLPNFGGQAALNLSSQLSRAGLLEKYGIQLIGIQLDAIRHGEDRVVFKENINRLGIEMPRSRPALSVEEAERIAEDLGYPVVLRPSYTTGGNGGGLVFNVEELRNIASRALSASFAGKILVEESVLGWEELELEVVRDAKNQMITVCFMENIDPVGVHSGDSCCTIPMLTIDPELQQRLMKYSYELVDVLKVIGGANIKFAHDPRSERVVVIEINARASRSSALASKATGFPIAFVSALLAGGLTLDEIPYWREGTLDKYTPWGDYIAVKLARWGFEKFKGIEDKLDTQMRSIGEVMSIGKTFKEAFQKAIRSLEIGRFGLGFVKDFHHRPLDDLLDLLAEPSSERQFIMYEALRKGASIRELYEKTHIKPWFIEQMKGLVDLEEEILRYAGRVIPMPLLEKAKKDGFSDRYLSQLLQTSERSIRHTRFTLGVVQGWEPVPVSGVEDAVYYFSSYSTPNQANSGKKPAVMILGSGPTRIGQGIEFDYCCVHAAAALREEGFESIMVNCNPETVSTDYDTSDRLYFEPLTVEDVLNIYEKEKPQGVIVQFGGQTPIDISIDLAKAGVKIIGTSPNTISLAENRSRFRQIMLKLGIPQPESDVANNLEEALKLATKIGYPLMLRPLFALGDRTMEVIHDEQMLRYYVTATVEIRPERPILIEKFLENAIEVEADAIADGTDAFVPTVMEHIELAGVHSGDSACVIPPMSIPAKHLATIFEYNRKIAIDLKVVGLMNIQYAISDDTVFIIDASLRASRTVPLVSKVSNIPIARIATQLMLGKRLVDLDLKPKSIPHFGVKEAVFPFNLFPEADPLLGPEMRSTGQVLGMADSFDRAYFRAQEAAQQLLPLEGTVLITVSERDRPAVLEVARQFDELGMRIMATNGTHKFLAHQGIASEHVLKMHEGRPNIVDRIKNQEIQLVINTPSGKLSKHDDSYIRKTAIKYNVPYITTLTAALAAARGIAKSRLGRKGVKSLQSYHAAIK